MSPSFIIDTSCLTQAHRAYYPFDIAPTFWNFIRDNLLAQNFLLINKVESEINRGRDELSIWLKKSIPKAMILDCHNDPDIIQHYGIIMNWADSQSQYTAQAKMDFADFNNADPFTIATALKFKAIVVSQEVSAPNAKKSIKIPDACKQFSIEHYDTFQLIRAFGFKM